MKVINQIAYTVKNGIYYTYDSDGRLFGYLGGYGPLLFYKTKENNFTIYVKL